MENQHSHNILFLGFGYVAQYFCKSDNPDSFNLTASRNTSKKQHFKIPNKVETINFSAINSDTLDRCDNFIISIPPFYQLKTDVVIDKFHDYFLSRKTPYKLIYLSSTSVYGDHEGRKVQENSALKSESVNGLARIECEKKYLELQSNEFANIIILRLAGIYGDKRNNILAIQSKNVIQNKPSSRVISRIHVVDIVGIIRAIILSSKDQNQVFNLADNHPCPTSEVNDYICEALLKIDKLPFSNEVQESQYSSFTLDNKIIDNSKLTKTLNYELTFPSYKEGLKAITADLSSFREYKESEK